MDWMLMPLKRYADFSGRSRRKEYWMFFLLQMIVLIALVSVGLAAGGMGEEPGGLFLILLLLYVAAFFIPNLAVQVRRFHDQDKSGWFVLLGFIPYLGGLIVLVFMCLEGTRGPNQYGDDPKGLGSAEVFE